MLLCVLESNKELSQPKDIIREIDSSLLLLSPNPASEVMGRL